MSATHNSIVQWIKEHYPSQFKTPRPFVIIDIAEQKLHLLDEQKILSSYMVSTSKHGIGNVENSFKTPLGLHQVASKIGGGTPLATIFKARLQTDQIATINSPEAAENDLITSRILWLEGLEEGVNKGAGIDSYQRYIYIHGTANEAAIGSPVSIGCVRMKNADVIHLFDRVDEGTAVILKA